MNKKLNIFINVSSIRQKNLSGIGNYLKNILLELFKLDEENNYYLYSFGYKKLPLHFDVSKYQNVFYKNIRIPNKLLFITNYFFGLPKIDILKHEGQKIKADIVWLPNIDICSLKNKKTKLITTIHDLSFVKYNNFLDFKRKLWHFLLDPKKIIKKSNAIICVSSNTALDVEKVYEVSSKKIFVSHLGIDKKFSKINDSEYLENIRKKYNLPKEFLLYVGTIEPRKNILNTIDSFVKLSKDFENLHLVICGDLGWKTKDFSKKLSLLDVETRSKIMFLRYFPINELPAIYNLSKVFIWPSYYEGFGLPILEAFACSCPVVSSNNSSIPEVLKNNAILVESFDASDLYSAIFSLLKDENLYKYYKNRKIDESYYNNWKKCAEDLIRVIRL
jgi:glycosyltransferase involved in cell wall biosynthesis